MAVTWEYGVAGAAAGLAGFVASVRLVLLPADLLLRREPTLTADEFKRAYPERAWLADWSQLVAMIAVGTMLGLFAAPVKWYLDPALKELDEQTRWPVTCGVYSFVLFQWMTLPLAVLELATGITLSFRGQAQQSPQGRQVPQVICSPEVWRAGVLRLALTLAAFAATAGVVEAFRP